MVTGIIAEFNPFHFGHQYLLNTVKKDSDVLVVAMSQDIVQRGEFSFFNKWWRTKLALESGADLVVGLPSIISSQSAEFFAHSSVRFLNALGIERLAFGAENPDLIKTKEIASILNREPDNYRILLKENIKKGYNFPRARMIALEEILNTNLETILKNPNNILGIEYAKAVESINPNISMLAVKRMGSDYNSLDLESDYLSATAIRNAIVSNFDLRQLKLAYTPEELLNNFTKVDESFIFKTILYKLLTENRESLKNISGMNADLLNRLLRAPQQDLYSLEELLNFLKTKNITRTALKRVLLNVILDIKASDIERFNETEPYFRVLGFNNCGKKLLANTPYPKITSLKHAKLLDRNQNYFLDIDNRVANLKSLFSGSNEFEKDLKNKPIIYE